ncbi:MAG: PaaI family thioesterase [Alphaproteobacteria bacterium]|nr:PaaI family thioesterase [Alphaproteobacteria bacterium]
MENLKQKDLSGFAHTLGYHLAEWDEGFAKIILPLNEKHYNRLHIPHGGVLASLIDTACGYAGTYPINEQARTAVTLSLNCQFINKAENNSELYALGYLLGGGKTIFFSKAEIYDASNKLIACGDGTFRYLNTIQKNNS